MRTAVRSAALIAFSVACGYAKLILFPFLFFVELFSVAVFLSGALVGPVWGAWVGGVARLVFSVGNPYGPPHPLVLGAQVLGGVVVGILGGIVGPFLAPKAAAGGTSGRRAVGARGRAAILVGSGIIATLAYDLLTNLAQGIVFGSIPATLALGAIPALQHVGSNALLFLVL
ncbi:MAG: hypothetical protein ACRENN_06130, partial [Candidatus Eiseniibacteriota bacterium]